MGTAPVWPMRHGFTAGDLPGCTVWLRPDLGATTTAGIQRWIDLSGQGNHAYQDTAADSPVLSGTALSTTRATGTHMTRAAIAALDSGYTIGVAFKFRALTTGVVQSVLYNGVAGTNGMGLGVSNPTPHKRWTWHHGGATASWGNATLDPETWVARHDGAGASADFCLDGAHQAPQGLANNVAPTTTFGIGASGAGSFVSDADVYGIIAYSDRKSDAVTLSISAYLTALRDGTALPTWRPTDETNLVLWLERADRYAGSHVEQLDDQSGNGYHVATAAFAQRPVLIPYGSGGRPYIHFDGTDDRLTNAGLALAQPAHAFVVAMPSESAAAGSYLIDGDGLNDRAIYTTATPGLGADAGTLLDAACVLDVWHYADVIYNGATSRVVIDSGAPVLGNAGAGAASALTLGAAGDLSAFGDCRIAELAIYSQVQGTRSIAAMNAYLASHYEI